MAPLVIKIGGAILETESALKNLLSEISKLKDQQVVLVHGGGSSVAAMLAQAGFTTAKKHGLRVTPPPQMPIISGALAGFVNKTIVGEANDLKLNAVGLSLADGQMISCKLLNEELGSVGQPSPNDSHLLNTLLSGGFFPVISSIGVSKVSLVKTIPILL